MWYVLLLCDGYDDDDDDDDGDDTFQQARWNVTERIDGKEKICLSVRNGGALEETTKFRERLQGRPLDQRRHQDVDGVQRRRPIFHVSPIDGFRWILEF